MTIVADASIVTAALIDSGKDGRWAERILEDDGLAAPQHFPPGHDADHPSQPSMAPVKDIGRGDANSADRANLTESEAW